MVPVLKREIHNGHFSRPHVVRKNSIISFLMTLELQRVTFKEDSAHRDDPPLGFKRVEDDDYHTTRGCSHTKKWRTTTTLQDLPDESRRRVDRFGQQDICHSFACFELTFIDVNFNESPLDAPVESVATNTGRQSGWWNGGRGHNGRKGDVHHW